MLLYPDKKLAYRTCLFEKNIPHGGFIEQHPNGKTSVAGKYNAGVKVGRWFKWDDKGRKKAEGLYREGTLLEGAPVGNERYCEDQTP